MPKIMNEDDLEKECLDLFANLGYSRVYGPDISEGGVAEERKYCEVVLVGRMRDALRRINRSIPEAAIEEEVKKVLRTDSQDLVVNNQLFHKLLVDGVPVEYKRADGSVKDEPVWLFDFKNVDNNEFLAVNQFTIIEERNNRRPDIILFINGLPLVLIELKNPADEDATVWSAFKQLKTYRQQLSSVFRYNEILIISDGLQAKAGTLSLNKERFTPWKTINNQKAPANTPEIEVLLKGMLNKNTLLDLVQHFVVFEPESIEPKSTNIDQSTSELQTSDETSVRSLE
jgi:type I restriction enzyme, R subunit